MLKRSYASIKEISKKLKNSKNIPTQKLLNIKVNDTMYINESI